MPISFDRFESQGHFATYDPFVAVVKPVTMFTLQCHSCGYEPQDVAVPPRLCPKCHGESWERFARPGSILENAQRH